MMGPIDASPASVTILDMLHNLEQKVEDKIKENMTLRLELEQQQQHCLQQQMQLQKMYHRVQTLEEHDTIDVADVINLEWEKSEIPASPKPLQNEPISLPESWFQLAG